MVFFNWYRNFSNNVLVNLPSNRLLSLDVFRGITITAMVLVNNPGSWSYVYWPMAHAKWHGWTPTDLIFPFFVFIIGISISIVLGRRPIDDCERGNILRHAIIRGIKLIGLGLFLALFFYNFTVENYNWVEEQLKSIRVMGVLQRLGLVFILTMAVALYFKRVGRAVIFVGLLLGYWAALMLIPYSSAELGVFQGRLEFGNSLTAWVDANLFSAKHLYYSEAMPFPFDPEGILSTFPTVAGAIAGLFTGDILLSKKIELETKVKYLLVSGGVCLVLAAVWSLTFPINKSIWTSSFVLLSTGWGLVLLGLLTYLVDLKGYKTWTAPFVVFGANAIAFYLFSAVVARLLIMVPIGGTSLQGWLYSQLLQPVFGDYIGSLMFAVLFCVSCFFVMNSLYKNKIFFKV